MRTRCRYTELNYHAVQYLGEALMRNVKCRSKEGLSLTDIKVGIPVGAPVHFLEPRILGTLIENTCGEVWFAVFFWFSGFSKKNTKQT